MDQRDNMVTTMVDDSVVWVDGQLVSASRLREIERIEAELHEIAQQLELMRASKIGAVVSKRVRELEVVYKAYKARIARR
jgi:hypothetical protein